MKNIKSPHILPKELDHPVKRCSRLVVQYCGSKNTVDASENSEQPGTNCRRLLESELRSERQGEGE